MIDWQRVTELHEEVGEEDFEEIVELFLQESDEAIARLRSGLPKNEWESCLHFLKGSALNLGFRHLSEICAAWEAAAETGQYDRIDLDEVAGIYDSTRAQFLAGLNGAPPK